MYTTTIYVICDSWNNAMLEEIKCCNLTAEYIPKSMVEILHIRNWVAAMGTREHIIVHSECFLLCFFPNHLKQMVAKRSSGSVHFFCQAPYVESINNSLLSIIQAWNHIHQKWKKLSQDLRSEDILRLVQFLLNGIKDLFSSMIKSKIGQIKLLSFL